VAGALPAQARLSDFNKYPRPGTSRLRASTFDEGRHAVMQVLSVSAVTITSPDPERLATFYRERLGVPLEAAAHGPMKHHFEASLGDPAQGGVHFAVLKGKGPTSRDAGGTAPTFRVSSLADSVGELEGAGAERIQPIIDLGEGKRVASFRDPDGNVFRRIELQL
jgi:predicted enzyme related to lactoylglutathione lyase